jgi:hypothetical protein
MHICVRWSMVKKTKTTDNQIISRIYDHDRGWVFTLDHFNYPSISGCLQSGAGVIDLFQSKYLLAHMSSEIGSSRWA